MEAHSSNDIVVVRGCLEIYVVTIDACCLLAVVRKVTDGTVNEGCT